MATEPMILAESEDWEAAFFGCPVIRLSFSVGAPLAEWLETRPAIREYIITRIPTEDIASIHLLEQHGFRMLVPMVMLESYTNVSNSSETIVISVETQDVPYLAEIARCAFVHGRFSAEPELPRDIVGEMYATWARNCCDKSLADEVLVIHAAGHPVGFIAIRNGDIELIAVTPTMQGRGIGSALIEAALTRGPMSAWTPLTNIPAIRMYERCGFRMKKSSLYYRLWRLG